MGPDPVVDGDFALKGTEKEERLIPATSIPATTGATWCHASTLGLATRRSNRRFEWSMPGALTDSSLTPRVRPHCLAVARFVVSNFDSEGEPE